MEKKGGKIKNTRSLAKKNRDFFSLQRKKKGKRYAMQTVK